ncbi:hypothetical protein [Anaeromyxobacter paludicola]|uniref:Ig-like domain-containing protein n=1 Tax=Anaeromyxobacter paludicola TaxID=2918171 RepID=A0ABN6N5Q8_9BACT|nr:hypothetical protein [Anaeromyxobacter paludicola]BDG08532.1 hypothetical protein AMPC_16450 [Anaeromyxobacter paludicola]
MNAKTLGVVTLAALLTAACGKDSGSSSAAAVHFMAVDGTNSAASLAFQALSAQDATTVLASQRVTTFSPAGLGREFIGDLALAPGDYVFKAVAYDAQGVALGEGEAEDARPITTTRGAKTSISITIVAYQHPVDPVNDGPVITSFVVTPTGATLPVNTPVSLAATVSYAGSNPLQYQWAQDCHGVFSTPTDGLTATWSDANEEQCKLSFTVSDTVSGKSDNRYVSLSCACLGSNQIGQPLVICE